jgi:23S rRNA (cytidine1920-2'-O)/16S rRNA (cytidine1409-2'-O)-methyltransferase
VGRKPRTRLRRLRDELLRAHPSIGDPDTAIARGAVVVDGRIADNPESLIREGVAIALRLERPLRGETKLKAALAQFSVAVRRRVALDIGAAAGGFTRALLDAGARRVYAVDAGHGQLLGSLRCDARVVNLEATNLGSLDASLVPETIELITLDLSYLSVAAAVPQLDALRIVDAADAVVLVKPQFELALARPPVGGSDLARAVAAASDGLAHAGWSVVESMRSPVTGARGAIEYLVHARRCQRS